MHTGRALRVRIGKTAEAVTTAGLLRWRCMCQTVVAAAVVAVDSRCRWLLHAVVDKAALGCFVLDATAAESIFFVC